MTEGEPSPTADRPAVPNAPTRPPTRLAACMHEAAHAIVQLANVPAPWIDSVAVDGLGGDMLGLVATRSMWQAAWMTGGVASPETREQWRVLAWRDVVNYLAGPIAELRWRRHSRPALWLGAREMAERCFGDELVEDHTDFGRVRHRLLETTDGDRRERFVEAWTEAEDEVARWWREIVQLGRSLDERGRIGDVELRDMWADMKAAREGRRGGRRRRAEADARRDGSAAGAGGVLRKGVIAVRYDQTAP